MLNYCIVKQRIGAITEDTPDDDDRYPDYTSVFGQVVFAPTMANGSAYKITDGDGLVHTVPATRITAQIVNGEITHEGLPGLPLFAAGSNANPSTIVYTATYTNLTAAGLPITLNNITFRAVPGETIDLSSYTPVAGAPTPGIIQGPPGHSPFIGQNGNWWINRKDTGVAATSPLVHSYTELTEAFEENTMRVKALEAMNGVSPESPVDGQTASLIEQSETLTRSAVENVSANLDGTYPVTLYGAVGDGATDDTAAFQDAIDAADGRLVTVPPGTYVVDGLKVTGKANIELADEATLFHPAHTSHADMITFTGTHLKIRGGTIDGNHPNQGGIARIVRSFVPTGTTIDVERVHFRRTANVIVSVQNFGGYLNFSHNDITEQKEHNGTPGHHTTICQVESGQQGGKGLIRTNHNRAVFYDIPRDDGSNPGGFFVAVNGYDQTGGGGPMTPGFANGNLSTWEATGNYFYGYGQHYSVNDISPLHTYPTIAGARWTNNYFEACGFSAVSAKSVQDFIFTGNVIKNGMISDKNTNTEGAIAYLPGYQASTFERPRAIISGNIVINPGGQTEVNRQACITVSATGNSIARDVIISNNILEGGGIGVRLHYARDVIVSGNQITGGTTSITNGDHGIVLERTSGTVTVTGNTVTATKGRGIQMLAGDTVDMKLSGNTWKQSGAVHAIDVRGAESLSVVGDTIDVETLGLAWMIRGEATGKKLGHLHWADVKSPHPGTSVWAEIAAVSGTLMGNYEPTAVPAAQSGVLYQQLNSAGDPALWVANTPGTGGWMRLGAGGSSGGGGGQVTANRLLGWNFDPIVAVAGQQAPASGEVWLAKIPMSTTGRITKVMLSLATGGEDLTYCRLGIYSAEGALIATSGDLTSVMSTAGNKYIDLSTPSQLTAGTEVYVGLLWTGTQGPAIRGAAGTGIANMGITETSQLRFSVSGSGLSALPATLGGRVDSQIRGWVGVS